MLVWAQCLLKSRLFRLQQRRGIFARLGQFVSEPLSRTACPERAVMDGLVPGRFVARGPSLALGHSANSLEVDMSRIIVSLLLSAGLALPVQSAFAADAQRVNGDVVALDGATLKVLTDGGQTVTSRTFV